MTEEERIRTFIHSFDSDQAAYLDEIERHARQTHVPVIRTRTRGLLKLLLAIRQPARILEVGTATGFSALFMSEYAPVGCEVVTVERYGKWMSQAREHFAKYGEGKKIIPIEGEAMEILTELKEPFDFIFMDAAKGQYLFFLPHLLRLLNKGGILVSDNVLREGDVPESRYAVTRRNRTIHGRMRKYLYELTHREELCTEILPVEDGVAVSYKRW